MTKQILCVGVVYIDTILDVPEFPIEDQKLRATGHTRRRGGNCANTLEVLSQLVSRAGETSAVRSENPADDTHIHLVAVLPNKRSDAANFIRKSLPNVGIDRSCIFRSDFREAAASYILQNRQNNSRTIISHNPLPEMRTEEFIDKVSTLAQNDAMLEGWCHFEGRMPDVTKECVGHLQTAKEQQGLKVSVECEKPERDYMDAVAGVADVVFYSRLWAESKGWSAPRNFLTAMLEHTRPDALLCCTWGSRGAVIVQKDNIGGTRWAHTDAWQSTTSPSEVIDTIGAGDTFIAGMLYALVCHAKSMSLQQKLDFANELAGRKVVQTGFTDLVKKMQTSFKDSST